MHRRRKTKQISLHQIERKNEDEWVQVLKEEKSVKKDSKPAALVHVPRNEGARGVFKKVTTYYEKKKA